MNTYLSMFRGIDHSVEKFSLVSKAFWTTAVTFATELEEDHTARSLAKIGDRR